jgi:hypothetical protein
VWDHGRKTFVARNQPHIFGYWGDVLFPAMALPILVEQIDAGVIETNPNRPYGAPGDALRRLWKEYPDKERRSAGIIMGHRQGNGMRCRFSLAVMTFQASTQKWTRVSIPMPDQSAQLRVAGSGSTQIRASQAMWNKDIQGGTSRAVFSAFCEALATGSDPKTGGGPQLVGLHRIGPARTFGVVYDRRRYFVGARVRKRDASLPDTQWFNSLFERVDGQSMSLLPGAKRHVDRQR